MKRGLVLAAVSEAATGLMLMIVPSLGGQGLFGAELAGSISTLRSKGLH